MLKFTALAAGKVRASKSGQKTGGDKAPILRATISKNAFRMNALMGKTLNMVTGDRAQLFSYPVGNGDLVFIIAKDLSNGEASGSGKVMGQDKTIDIAGKQGLRFTYSGMYTEMIAEAAKTLEFDANERVEVAFKVADTISIEDFKDLLVDEDGNYTYEGELEDGGVALLLTPSKFVIKEKDEVEAEDEDADEDEAEDEAED